MRVPRCALLAVSSVALVASSIAVVTTISGASAIGGAPPSALAGPRSDTRSPTGSELTASAAAGAHQASIELAAQMATPQTIADAFYVTQSIAELHR